MLKKSLESFLVAGLLTSSAVGETYGSKINRILNDSSYRQIFIDNYKIATEKDRNKFDLYFKTISGKDFKENYNVSWGYKLNNEDEYMLKVKNRSFRKGVKKFVNTDCSGISCVDYMDKKLWDETKNFPSSIVDGRHRLNINTREKKFRILKHYFTALGYHESGLDKTEVSIDNAVGIFQIVPCTGKNLMDVVDSNYKIVYSSKKKKKVCHNYSYNYLKRSQQYSDDRSIPRKNIDAGIELNIKALKKFGDIQYALVDHIAGGGKVKFYQKCSKNKSWCNSKSSRKKLFNEIKGLVLPVTKWIHRLNNAYLER